MSSKLVYFIFLIAALRLANGQNLSRPDVPDPIKVPPSDELVFAAHASGVQIYTCHPGADGPAWALKAPEAQLRDQQGKVVGRHYAGPTSKHNDGSQVTGKAAARVDSPDKESIPGCG